MTSPSSSFNGQIWSETVSGRPVGQAAGFKDRFLSSSEINPSKFALIFERLGVCLPTPLPERSRAAHLLQLF
jgi:hypothetical protein